MVYTIDDLRRIIAPIAEQYGLRAVSLVPTPAVKPMPTVTLTCWLI